jgi:hypothetical protein
MRPAKLAPGRNIDLNEPYMNGSPEVNESELRSQVEDKFVEMSEAHDRIRGEYLQSQREKRSDPGRTGSIYHL